MMWYMEFIFGRAGAALLSPCHGEGQDVHRGQCDFRVTARCVPRAVRFSCHGKMCAAGSAIFLPRQDVCRGRVAAGSAIFVSRQDVRCGQCDFRVTASLPPQTVRFSCHGKMCAAGSAIFVSQQNVRCGRAANKPPRAVRFSCHGVSAAAGSAIFVSRQDVRRGRVAAGNAISVSRQNVHRGQCNFPCHDKMCTTGSAIFLSRQDVRCGQCDFRVTAKCTLRAGRRRQFNFLVTARCAPRACRLRQCDSRATARCALWAGRKHTAAPSGYAGFRRLSASIQNACSRKARASGILNRFAAPTIPHAVLTTAKTAPKAIKLW